MKPSLLLLAFATVVLMATLILDGARNPEFCPERNPAGFCLH